jgi:poly(A) polymerase
MIQFDSNIFPKTKGAYIIGGSIRDLLLGRTPADYDVAVLGNPEKFANHVALQTNGHLVEMGKPGQMIIRVVTENHIVDISPVNGLTIEDDLNQRDFTINAMAYDLSTGKMIDVLGGLQDLEKKKVKMVSKQIFKKDPIRLLRAFRMGACLGFDIEPQTSSAIAREATIIQESAGERIRLELFKMFETDKSHYYLSQMAKTGLLTAIFPELGKLKKCFQNRHHCYDVFEHSIKAYGHLEEMLSKPDNFLPAVSHRGIAGIDRHKAILLKCAILLHDIGKPAAKSLDHSGQTRFYGHARKGADMAKSISTRFKFATRERNFIDFIIRNHIRPLSLFSAQKNKTLTLKGITRFFMKCKENTPYLLLHTIADIKGKQDKANAENKAFITFVKGMLDEYFAEFSPKSKTQPLITGHDLIEEFGLTPSPSFKKILNLAEEARLSNTIGSKPEALKLVNNFLKQQKKHET